MKKIHILVATLVLGFATSCKEQLDVKNPNQPTVSSANTEQGVINLAQGGVYINGSREIQQSLYDGVPGYFWSGAMGVHELMGDIIGEEAANQFGNQIGAPDYVILDDGSKVLNPNAPNTQIALIRQVNVNSNQGANPLFHEWWYMYSLNSQMNKVLELADQVSFTGDAAAKKATIQAWAYWWKGFAYSHLGSIYYAGIINSASNGTNGNYVSKEKLIEEANTNLDKAAALLATTSTDYTALMGRLIPSFNQVGKGGVPTPDMWKRNISTLKARNLLVNTTTKAMTAAQWNQVLTLANNGITATDNVFTGRSNQSGDFLAPQTGTVAAKATGDPSGGATYKISERLIQDFKTGDQRLANNFTQRASPWIGESSRGHTFNTRWALVDGGKKTAGVYTYSDRAPGGTELYLAGSYEENELMKAEALINTGKIEDGLKSIDAVRKAQGAGIAAVAGTNLTLDQAKEELRRERRVALAFRSLSFYDARRWGVIEDVSKGGGRKGAVIIDKAGKLNTNSTLNYNFLDYWDVPDNELKYNAPAANSAPTTNPKQ
ncbi:RagB/SusD family nutrient uptake outer membrane protein [Spirosoma sp. BT702]|uniref:RagB/SusD family nutrient uptake outer membrane protein n=1 Tax=Spirosoma profusum TaxID=2771354 RepID=A0A927AN62_9BACT|nr:RagB/SusD family nutrient uptake outer membrane protein [Spirosoma profusum]MBD2701204.1 RagB/SusD family nutrient uptake outer membrane protein [Spirosoma profusum]